MHFRSLPFPPTLDMQHLFDSEFSSIPNSSEHADLLMLNPFLDFLNEVLLEEGVEDSPRPITQPDAQAYYQATLRSLYDIIAEQLPPDSTTSNTASVSHLSHQFVPPHDPTGHEDYGALHSLYLCDPVSQYRQQIDVCKPRTGFSSLTSGIAVLSSSIPARGNSHMSMDAEQTGRGSLPARDLTPISLEWGNAERSPLPAYVGLYQEKPETLPQQYELVQNSPSQADTAAHHRHLEKSDASQHAIYRGLSNVRSRNESEEQDLEQGIGNPGPLLATSKSTFGSACLKVPSGNFKDETGYAALYAGKTSAMCTVQTGSSLTGDKKFSDGRYKASKSGSKGKTEVEGFMNVSEMLVDCAKAVAIGDGKQATEIVQKLYHFQCVSPTGNGMQRSAHYFCQALIARLGGMGEHCYRVMSANLPSVGSFIGTTRIFYERSPYIRLTHYFVNQNILKAAEGASRLHIVDYGIMYDLQWPCLINALADRKGGPPLLVITCVDVSNPGQTSLERLEQSGRRLAALAKTYNVPFQFHAIVTEKWDDFDPASLHLHMHEEVLVVHSMKRLCHLADSSVDSVSTVSPRQRLLMTMHSLKPHLFLISDTTAACNLTFFVSRFREALYFYANMFDMLDTVFGDLPERDFLERDLYAREILNIVACEGTERVERLETYQQLDVRIRKAGFEQLPIPSGILSRSRSHVRQYFHRHFMVHNDGKGWMLLGWKGRPVVAMSAWEPSHG